MAINDLQKVTKGAMPTLAQVTCIACCRSGYGEKAQAGVRLSWAIMCSLAPRGRGVGRGS